MSNLENKYLLLICLLLATLLFGCSDTDTNTNDCNCIQKEAIDFNGSIGSIYRKKTTTESIQDFRVSAVWAKSASDFVLGYMNKVHVKRENNTWNYTPTTYWPTEGSISFFAYSPAKSTGVKSFTIGGNDYNEVNIEYELTTDYRVQEDLLVANMPEQTEGTVLLDFDHALSYVAFRIENLSTADDIRLQSIKLYNAARKGTLKGTVNSASTPNTVWEWTPDNLVMETYPLYISDPVVVKGGSLIAGDLMLLPQELSIGEGTSYTQVEPQDLDSKFYIAVTYTLGSASPKTVYIPLHEQGNSQNPFDLKMGTKYTFIIGLEQTTRATAGYSVKTEIVGVKRM